MNISEIIKTHQRYKVLYSDFETTIPRSENEHPQVWLANILEPINDHEVKQHTYASLSEWYCKLWEFAKRHKNLIMWFHNIKFDCSYFVPYLLLQGFQVCNSENEVRKGDKRLYVHADGSRVFKIMISYKQSIIQFKDSYKILNASIKQLGKSYGIDKMGDLTKDDYASILEPFPSLDHVPTKWVEYIHRDCLIMYYAMRDFDAMLNQLSVVKNCIRQQFYADLKYDSVGERNNKRFNKVYQFTNYYSTVARISWELLCQHVANVFWNGNKIDGIETSQDYVDKFMKVPEQSWYESEKLMGGGMTQFSSLSINKQRPRFPHRSFVIDVNSAYPYWMSQLVPYGDLLDYQPEGDFVRIYEIDVREAVVKREYTTFPTWFTARVLRNDILTARFRKLIKNERVYFFEREWKALQQMYYIDTKSVKIRYMKALPLFKDYIAEIYEFKRIFGDKNDPRYNLGHRQGVKILLNAGYGCLAQEKDYGKKFVFRNDNQPEIITIKNEDGYHTGFEYQGEEYIITKVEEWQYAYNNVPHEQGYTCYTTQPTMTYDSGRNRWFAGYITSQERALIMEAVILFGAEHVRYCDTDSLLLIDLTPELVAKLHEICNDHELGRWKIEASNIYEYRTIRAKMWMYSYGDESTGKLKQTVKCAGVSQIGDNDLAHLYEKLINCEEGTELEITAANLIATNPFGTGTVLKPTDKILKIGGDQ